jgi:hypothetical protein
MVASVRERQVNKVNVISTDLGRKETNKGCQSSICRMNYRRTPTGRTNTQFKAYIREFHVQSIIGVNIEPSAPFITPFHFSIQ